MKLTNPTDAELNAAFAEKVCGWKRVQSPTWGEVFIHDGAQMELKDFTQSVDAVLPWLEKHEWRCQSHGFSGYPPDRPYQDFEVSVREIAKQNADGTNNFSTRHTAFGRGLARTAVIALLRAHGVEVEFSA